MMFALIEFGARVDLKNIEGETVFDILLSRMTSFSDELQDFIFKCENIGTKSSHPKWIYFKNFVKSPDSTTTQMHEWHQFIDPVTTELDINFIKLPKVTDC